MPALRRSVLYLPASNPRALVKARELPADVLVFDLEDAVAPDQKVAAREQLRSALALGGYGERELVVRVNGRGTPWHADDVSAVLGSAAHALCLPKVESAEEVRVVAALVERAGAGQALWAMAETPRGVLAIGAIAASHPLLQVIMLGTSDLVRDLRARHTPNREAVWYALSHCVMAARAHGLDVIDGVHLDLADDAGLAAACEQGRTLGFDGKSLIHPGQIAAANAAFSPSPRELERAARMIQAWEAAQALGQAVLVLDGKLVENLHVEEAGRLLRLQAAIERRS